MAKSATAQKPVGNTRLADPGRELSDAEVAMLGAAAGLPQLPNLEDGETFSMTEAELALLEEKGATVAISDDGGRFAKENPNGLEDGTVLFKIGEGKSQFTGTLTDVDRDPEKIRLWDPITGSPRALRRAHLFYYVAKGFLTRPPFERAAMKVPCPSRMGPKAGPKCRWFTTAADAADHFRRAHQTEWKQVRTEREAARQDRLDAILEKLSTGGGDNGNAAMLAVLAELTKTVAELRETGIAGTRIPVDGSELVEAGTT